MDDQGQQIISPPDVGAAPPGHSGAGLLALTGALPPGDRKPGPYDDDKKLLEVFKRENGQTTSNRWAFERIWWRNLLYLLDRQWIRYDRTRGTWVDKRIAKWVPRPVTNKMRETHAAISAVFQAVQLQALAKPNGSRPLDMRTAETVNLIEPAIRAEHQMDRVLAQMDFWLIACGNAFLHPWWDKRFEGGHLTIALEQCVVCQGVSHPADVYAQGNRCPSCGSPGLTMAFGQDGEPLVEKATTGRGCTDVLSPFEVGVSGHVTNFDDANAVIRRRFRPKSWFERFHPELTKDVTWETMPIDRSLQFLKALAAQNDMASGSMALGANDSGELEGLTENELWLKPDEDFPEGLILRVAGEDSGGKVIRIEGEGIPGPLPYRTQQGQPMIPFIHVGYEQFGGRMWARSPLDSLIQKQDQLNQLDSLTQLIVTRMGNPIWLEPKGAEVQKFTGQPGLVVKYNPNLAGGNAKPERIPGENVPHSIIQLRQSIIDDIENLAGTYDIIKGQKPAGVEAFSALQLLVERSQSRYGPVLSNRGLAYQRWFEIAVELERQYGPLERTWASLGPNGGWAFEEFKSANLQGAVVIQIEDGSQAPKTSLGKRAAVQQLSSLGVIDVRNPDTAYRILQVYGQPDLWPGLDAHVNGALQEQDAFERWAREVEMVPVMQPNHLDPMAPPMQTMTWSSPPPGAIKVWHRDEVHLVEHMKWANGDSVRRILEQKPQLEPVVSWMIDQHQQRMALMAAPPEEMPPGTGSDGKGVGAGRAFEQSNTESDNPSDVPSGEGEGPQNRGPE